MPGSLFVVATPIGNLEDITLRALRVLREVDVIAAEDTRRTAKLLAHYEIQKPVVSVHEHNESRETARLIERLLAGESIALVSDAGTPVIADPGAHLVAKARTAGIRVVPIPGASAPMAALSASGAPGAEFVFLGFPPSSGLERDNWMERLWATRTTAVFFESPHRIERTLGEISEVLANRPIIVARELTKIHEELVEWDNKTAINATGEFVVVVSPPTEYEQAEVSGEDVAIIFGQLAEATSLPEPDLIRMTASHFNLSPTKAKNLIKKGAIALKRQRESTEP